MSLYDLLCHGERLEQSPVLAGGTLKTIAPLWQILILPAWEFVEPSDASLGFLCTLQSLQTVLLPSALQAVA